MSVPAVARRSAASTTPSLQTSPVVVVPVSSSFGPSTMETPSEGARSDSLAIPLSYISVFGLSSIASRRERPRGEGVPVRPEEADRVCAPRLDAAEEDGVPLGEAAAAVLVGEVRREVAARGLHGALVERPDRGDEDGVPLHLEGDEAELEGLRRIGYGEDVLSAPQLGGRGEARLSRGRRRTAADEDEGGDGADDHGGDDEDGGEDGEARPVPGRAAGSGSGHGRWMAARGKGLWVNARGRAPPRRRGPGRSAACARPRSRGRGRGGGARGLPGGERGASTRRRGCCAAARSVRGSEAPSRPPRGSECSSGP